MRRRSILAGLSGLLAACSPLQAFNTFAPRDPARAGPRDLAYGDHPRQRLDLYAPKGEARTGLPVIVFFYGGSWNSGRRQDYAWVGQALAAQWFLVAVADYRLVPEVRFPAFIEDGARPSPGSRPTPPASAGTPRASRSAATPPAPTSRP